MNIAMIGTGGMAQHHLKVLAHEPGVQIVGHVSPTPEHRMAAAERWGGGAYASCEELIEHESIDAAWIAVPPGAHGAIELCLIEHGIPFFVEKPLSVDRETAIDIGKALQEQELIVGVGYHWRAMETIPEVRRILADNPARMILAAWHDATPAPSWWRKQAQSGGQMVEQATHLFDIARHLLGEARVLEARGSRHERPSYPEADIADVSAALLQFDAGVIGVFTATCLLERAAAVQVQLVCEGLLITITREGVSYETGWERREVRLRESPVATEDRAFLEAVRQSDPSLLFSSYEDALRTHHLTFDVLKTTI